EQHLGALPHLRVRYVRGAAQINIVADWNLRPRQARFSLCTGSGLRAIARLRRARLWLGGCSRFDVARAEQAGHRAAVRDLQAQWVTSVARVRGSLGSLKSRRLVSAKYARSLHGAPDGEYVVIQFATSFEKRAEATETVTPMKDRDGRWRVSGYFIR